MMAGVVYEQELEIIYLKPYHSWNPSSLIKGGDRTFQKLGHWGGGVQNFLLEVGDKWG